jgi:hypothetical protein
MFTSRMRRTCLCAGALVALLSLNGCASGAQPQTFDSRNGGTPVVAPTNVTGQSNTSGISAGSGLQSPGATPTPK